MTAPENHPIDRVEVLRGDQHVCTLTATEGSVTIDEAVRRAVDIRMRQDTDATRRWHL